MKLKAFFTIIATLIIGACNSHSDYCVVKGTIKGIDDGAKIEMQDAWNHYKVIALGRLSPELADKEFVVNLKEELTRRARTEPRVEGSDIVPVFIDIAYPNAEGKTISLSSVVNNSDNRYVLLDFWATWCEPCVNAIPQLKAIYAKYHEKGFEIYSVSQDPGDQRWKPFLEENGMIWINVLDDNAGRKNSKAWTDYALNGIPTVVLIDGETGEIIARGNHLDLDTILSGLLP